MADPRYVLEADESIFKKVPWWVWALGFGIFVAWWMRRKAEQREFEEYLR